MTRDELFIDLALKTKLLTPAQIEDCRKLRHMLEEQAFSLTLPEIVARKEFLNPDQLRLINVAIRYEEMKRDDEDLAAFIVRKGFLPQDRISECLSAQELPFRQGRHFPRLEDQLIQKAYLSPQQIHVILRAREQLEAAKREAGSSPRVPRVQPSLPLPPEVAPPKPPPVSLKTLEAGLTYDTLKVHYRKNKPSDNLTVVILEIHGPLDAHTSRRFDAYLTGLVDNGITHVILSCDKLDYISSAGIGVLAGAVKKCRDAKGDLRLSGLAEGIRKIMHMVGLLSVVRAYDSERGAVMSFKYG